MGDDAAVLAITPGTSVVVTTDVLLEGLHFRFDWSSPEDVGYKAVSVNVSDIAAMGARPRWVLVGLGAPSAATEKLLRSLYDGMREACEEHGCALVGGDTVHSQQLLLAVTALGEVEVPPLTRVGAKPGDQLAVTGPLGLAACGVNLLLAGPDLAGLVPGDVEACLRAHRRPRARIAGGLALRESGVVHAALDLSDGLYSDVRRLAQASGVGVEIDESRIPIAPEVTRIASRRGWKAERLAGAGGEDFELLVAVEPGTDAGVPLLPVGRVVADGLWLVRGSERVELPPGGWDHFRAPVGPIA